MQYIYESHTHGLLPNQVRMQEVMEQYSTIQPPDCVVLLGVAEGPARVGANKVTGLEFRGDL